MTSSAIQKEGMLMEVDAQIMTELTEGCSLAIRLDNLTAASTVPSGKEFSSVVIEVTNGSPVLEDIPDQFRLESNYPNPFNPTTRIRYKLPVISRVSVEIYNTLGQRVRILADDERQDAGYYRVEWNGRNEDGKSVASGIYFYRLIAESRLGVFIKTQKMMLLK